MPKSITRIEAPIKPERLKRVAAYARVSSGKDAMLHSLSAQVSYYSRLIQSHEGWRYCGVYADEALTGTKEDRAEFQRLISDCHAGKLDIVITKSISRFARNTVTLLETVRELKALEVDVFFEEQNIHSISTEGELMLTILASFAQAESLSASENQKWRIRKGFKDGELINWRFMFGYIIHRGIVEVDEETAPIVREIFNRVIGDESLSAIARELNCRGVKTVFSNNWTGYRIRELVQNEKYIGNALLQKTYKNNHLEKKQLRNTGELPQYYAEETHPAIVDAEIYQAAQEALARISEKTSGRSKPHYDEFTGKIRCPFCSKNYKRVTNNRCVGWNCSTYQSKGAAFCHGKKSLMINCGMSLPRCLDLKILMQRYSSSILNALMYQATISCFSYSKTVPRWRKAGQTAHDGNPGRLK